MGSSEGKSFAWVALNKISLPKELGGWGLKNPSSFAKALAAKVIWRLLNSDGLWAEVIYHKYIFPCSVVECARLGVKSYRSASVSWWALIKSFNLTGDWLVWRTGNGRCVRSDPWVGSSEHRLPAHMVIELQSSCIPFLSHVTDMINSTVLHQYWLTANQLSFTGEDKICWEKYISCLARCHIYLAN